MKGDSSPSAIAPRIPRLALLADFREEGWPSMDLCADMLHGECLKRPAAVQVTRICPAWQSRLTRVPFLGRSKLARNADRAWNRFRNYPRHVQSLAQQFEWFHVCDHSYAHLVHSLLAPQTGVFCYDLEAFRCLLDPQARRSPWMQRLAQRVLTGLQRAALVFYCTQATRSQLLEHRLVPPERLVFAPLGVSAEFSPAALDDDHQALPAAIQGHRFILHIGSCIPRKRIDVLLDVFARVRTQHPALRLLQVGGDWTAEQRAQISRLALQDSIWQVRGISTQELAAIYRQATLVLQPSSYEGFGLPVLEALASGAVVVASEIPALREVGGQAAVYCPVGDVDAWTQAAASLLNHRQEPPSAEQRATQAAKFSWAEHARIILEAYQALGLPAKRA